MASSRINSIERGHTNGRSNGQHQQSSDEVYQEINRIRDEMDHTLDEIGGYLHPKHLLDYVVDSIRSGSPGSSKETVREYADRVICGLKRHPGPAMLAGGAVLWYLMDQNRQDDDVSFRSTRRGAPRMATYGAWEEGYDWSSAEEDEQTWSAKAKHALDQVRTVVADKSIAAKDKVKHVAKHLVGASGKTREQLHAQWANLREHSGSYVDARTGEPYDDSYGDTVWSQAEACACLCDENADDSSWSHKAQETVNSISESLKNTGASMKDQFQALGGHLSGLVSSGSSRVGNMMSASRDRVGNMASGARESMSHGWSSTSSGLHSAADSARHGVSRVGSSVSHGVRQGSDQFRRALNDQPLAVGAACLGLGLLAGLLAPMTRRENELMGETSDQLKEQVKGQAREFGEEAMQRGKEVATAVTGAAKKEAQRQGLTSENLAQTAKEGAGAGDMASQLSGKKNEPGSTNRGASRPTP